MAKFVYRMQSILDVKLKMEEQAKQAFAAAKIKGTGQAGTVTDP